MPVPAELLKHFTVREADTILAALRYWQRTATVCTPEFVIAANERTDAWAALTTEEIDVLCLQFGQPCGPRAKRD
jgi:hypothetical protein